MANEKTSSAKAALDVSGRFFIFNILGVVVWVHTMRWFESLPGNSMASLVGGAVLAYGIGALSGAYELLKYQKMSQENILKVDYGQWYWSTNGWIAVLGYTFINFMPELFPADAKTRHFAQAFAAGTGSMALIRTKYLGFAEGIERWLTYIEERLNAQLVQKNWEAIQDYLPAVGSKEELEIVFERIIWESEFVLKQEQVVRVKTEIEKARSAPGGETGRAYNLLRAYADIVGIDRLLIILGTVKEKLQDFRARNAAGRPPGGAGLSVMPQTKLPVLEVRDDKEWVLVLETFGKNLDGSLPAEQREAITRIIEVGRESKETIPQRVEKLVEGCIHTIGLPPSLAVLAKAQEELMRHRAVAK